VSQKSSERARAARWVAVCSGSCGLRRPQPIRLLARTDHEIRLRPDSVSETARSLRGSDLTEIPVVRKSEDRPDNTSQFPNGPTGRPVETDRLGELSDRPATSTPASHPLRANRLAGYPVGETSHPPRTSKSPAANEPNHTQTSKSIGQGTNVQALRLEAFPAISQRLPKVIPALAKTTPNVFQVTWMYKPKRIP